MRELPLKILAFVSDVLKLAAHILASALSVV